MSAREWTPGNRSMDGRKGPVEHQRYGSDVGGERNNRDESQERGSETTDRGLETRTLKRSEAHEGRYLSVVAIRAERRRRCLKSRRSSRVTDKDERAAGIARTPARAHAQMNHRNRRESVPFIAALKSPSTSREFAVRAAKFKSRKTLKGRHTTITTP